MLLPLWLPSTGQWIAVGLGTFVFLVALLVLLWLHGPTQIERPKPRGGLALLCWKARQLPGRIILWYWRKREARKKR